jgi:hypothetical protein
VGGDRDRTFVALLLEPLDRALGGVVERVVARALVELGFGDLAVGLEVDAGDGGCGRVEDRRVLEREVDLHLLPERVTQRDGIGAELAAVERRQHRNSLVACGRVVVGVMELRKRIGVFRLRLVLLLRLLLDRLRIRVVHRLRRRFRLLLLRLLLRLHRCLRRLVGERCLDLCHVIEIDLGRIGVGLGAIREQVHRCGQAHGDDHRAECRQCVDLAVLHKGLDAATWVEIYRGLRPSL